MGQRVSQLSFMECIPLFIAEYQYNVYVRWHKIHNAMDIDAFYQLTPVLIMLCINNNVMCKILTLSQVHPIAIEVIFLMEKLKLIGKCGPHILMRKGSFIKRTIATVKA